MDLSPSSVPIDIEANTIINKAEDPKRYLWRSCSGCEIDKRVYIYDLTLRKTRKLLLVYS